MDTAKADRVANGDGFIAALDQSGGSTPKALRLYGIDESAYSSEDEMFARIHEMRCRIMTAPDFTSEKILGAILFERTMRDTVEGESVPSYLWQKRGIVPFLKIDKGLEDKADGVQVMKPMPGLDALLQEAKGLGVFGTKERSVIHEADATGIRNVVAQQFEVARTVCAAGLVPIIEPEVDINSATKAEAEDILKEEILKELNSLKPEDYVMLKLTIPSNDCLYVELAEHPNVLRVVALSGGYTTDDACMRLSRNDLMIASFSRALTEGLTAQMSDEEFNAALKSNIDKIFDASKA
ncbi:fructose bisphosphate aldolase [Marivita sp. GX14005]|uniref:fructose bisphosphate aldolase n=1 Tax=Marivita sp. GX14005 TaxID=2942276 RepID=UPI002019B7B5|nr:fructose bisphosphate aldolase [Marivita sp. GX14005]MCL3882461.1 fructose bisphosphate aldolase [Marivita sp. GX14005]